MCISDWRIGRLIRHGSSTFNTVGPVNTTFAANRTRVGLLVEPTSLLNVTTALGVITFTSGAAVAIHGTASRPIISLATHGDLSTFGFTITALGAGFTGAVTEFFMPERYLAAALEEFMRAYQ